LDEFNGNWYAILGNMRSSLRNVRVVLDAFWCHCL